MGLGRAPVDRRDAGPGRLQLAVGEDHDRGQVALDHPGTLRLHELLDSRGDRGRSVAGVDRLPAGVRETAPELVIVEESHDPGRDLGSVGDEQDPHVGRVAGHDPLRAHRRRHDREAVRERLADLALHPGAVAQGGDRDTGGVEMGPDLGHPPRDRRPRRSSARRWPPVAATPTIVRCAPGTASRTRGMTSSMR